MKKNTQQQVPPRCARHYFNPEAALPGEASVAVNLRQHEQSLVVTGRPGRFTSIEPGHRLLLVDGNRVFTSMSGIVYCDGSPVVHTSHGIVAMHRVGEGIVVVTDGGLIHLRYDGDSCVVVDKADAVPAITLTATDSFTVEQSLDGITFDTPYTAWRSPLTAADISAITAQYRTAWKNATTQVISQGAYYTPLMACFGVRMWDDSYLSFSSPVTLGADFDNARQVTAQVTTASSRYTATEPTVMTMNAYRLGIAVSGGVGDHWLSLVKAIDVFVTDVPSIASTSSLDYRCVTTQGGTRTAALQFGWQAMSASRVAAQLEASGWTMVASTTDIGALSQGRFVASNVVYPEGAASGVVGAPLDGGARITREMVAHVMQGGSQVLPAASMVRNGRLYLASADGLLSCSAHGNAFSTSQVTRVTGASIKALAPVSRPLYSGGFGRYAAYLFTDEGIYAVAQSAAGTLGEARLVDRSVISSGCVPIDGNRDVYYVDRNHWLCRLTGSTVERLVPDVEPGAMAWDDYHGELYLLTAGKVMAVLPSGFYSHRTIGASSLYNDILHALAVTPSGDVLDLTHEESAEQQVEYLSHPVVFASTSPLRDVLWCMFSDEATLSLEVLGERGVSCHGFLVGRLRVNGAVRAPLLMPLVAPPCRCIRFRIHGSAVSGTVILPITLGT